MPEDNCLFCRLINGEVAADVLYQDARAVAIRDINPQAPVHALVIPKEHVESLDDIGQRVTYVGGNGLGLSLKIAHNISLVVQMLAFSEGVLLAEKNGIPREAAVDVFTHSAIASPMVTYRGPFVLQLPKEPLFNVNMMQKDLLMALEAGRESGVPLPTASTANEFLNAARAMGLADQDFAAVFTVLARMSGLPD